MKRMGRRPLRWASLAWMSWVVWLALLGLPLLTACALPSPTPTDSRATGDAAFAYTYYSQNGESGVAGARASDGAVVWRAPIGHANWRPIVVGSTLFACVWKKGFAIQDIVAMRVRDGHVLWTTEIPNASGFAPLIVADSATIAVSIRDSGLYALDALTGAIRWHAILRAYASPLVSAGFVVTVDTKLGGPGVLVAFRASDGTKLWEANDTADRLEGNATTVFAYTYVRTPVALDLHDGHTLWTGASVGVPIATTPHAVILSDYQPNDERLVAASLDRGALLWQTPKAMNNQSASYDIVPFNNDTLYLVTLAGLVAVDAADGTIRWRLNYPIGEVNSAIVVNGVVYVSRTIGFGGVTELIALNAASGAVLWRTTPPGAQLLAEPIASA